MTTHTKLANTLAGLIIFGGIFLVLYTTLFPFDFILRGDSFFKEIGVRFDVTWVKLRTPLDLLRNIVLFVPIGFGFTYILLKKPTTWIAVLTIGLGLSLTVELLQVLLPERDPSLSDLVTNGLGAILGYLAFYWWGYQIFDKALALIKKDKWLGSARVLAAIFIGYVMLFIGTSIYLQSRANLGNWDADYPLILGNERTGDRPWQGYISNLYIVDRALSEEKADRVFAEKKLDSAFDDSVLVSYQLDDMSQTEAAPNLSWRGSTSSVQNDAGVLLTPTQWLQTETPIGLITEKIREASQFTLGVSFASANIDQDGPARIVSISNDPFHRNFTLGQEGKDLNIRLRTPFTGENGQVPELVIPNVIVDSQPHQLIVTYNGATLRVYVDGIQRSYHFNVMPEVMLFRYFLPTSAWRIYLGNIAGLCYKLLYYSLVFVPQGVLLGMMTTLLKRSSKVQFLLLGGGILLPSLLLEGGLVYMTGSMIRVENILLSLIIAVAAMYASAVHINKLGMSQMSRKHIRVMSNK